jgi:hypothetical protein
VSLDPSNKDARLKLEECKKIVRQLAFFAAIEVGDEPSAAEGLDLDSMVVEPGYDGVRLGDEMTQEFIDDMIERFKTGKKIHRKYVYQIIIAVKKLVYDEPTMVEVEIPSDVKLTVCGDTHGKSICRSEVYQANSPLQVNTLILWSCSATTEPPTRSTGIFSTVISWTEVLGRLRSLCSSMLTSGCDLTSSS